MRRFMLLFMACPLFAMGEVKPSAKADKALTVVELQPQQSMRAIDVPAGDYSGITHIKGDVYAVVSDKETADGFYPFTIRLDSLTGEVREVYRNGMVGHKPRKMTLNSLSARDAEDIVYHPSTNTFFIAGEGDQRVVEVDFTGKLTGRELQVPEMFSTAHIQPNRGFESLAYDAERGLFWTMTEGTLKTDLADGDKGEGVQLLRLQSFGEDLRPLSQYAYRTETPSEHPSKAVCIFGVSALTAMEDGRLLVLERDAVIKKNYLGSYVEHKLFLVDPLKEGVPLGKSVKLSSIPESHFLRKQLLTSFRTHLTMFDWGFANFEGMCLGPRLADGRRTLLLINDSQHHYGNALFHLKDYVKVVIF